MQYSDSWFSKMKKGHQRLRSIVIKLYIFLTSKEPLTAHNYQDTENLFPLISGNLSSLVTRGYLQKKKSSTAAFPVFVSSLCHSDLLMGLYLLIIGIADQVFQGSYLWNELTWRNHAMCQVK